MDEIKQFNAIWIRKFQLFECFIIFFPIIYSTEWLYKLIVYKKNPYDLISFNKEIRFYSHNPRYLEFRINFIWTKYF